ncbi:MAG TPA: purine-nucleoside phosphorylase, partial [Saprospirales bacterium]|nr:purine-nucleoside phosphorylase [Saprospirales bacterium]
SEYNMLHIMGADVVGMSTVPEVIVAKHAEIKTLVCSIVSNVCYPPEHITETTLEEVIAVAQESGDQLKKVWEALIKEF